MEGGGPPNASTRSCPAPRKSSTLWRFPSCRVRYARSHTHSHTHAQAGPDLLSLLQVNYGSKLRVKRAPSPLYSQLADPAEIQFAREMTELQSEVEHIRHLRLLRDDSPRATACLCFGLSEQVQRRRPAAPLSEFLLSAPSDGGDSLR